MGVIARGTVTALFRLSIAPPSLLYCADVRLILQAGEIVGKVDQFRVVLCAFIGARIDGVTIVTDAFLRRVIDDQHALEGPPGLSHLGERLEVMEMVPGIEHIAVIIGRHAAKRRAAATPDEVKRGRIWEDLIHHRPNIIVRGGRPDGELEMLRTCSEEDVEMRAAIDVIAIDREVGRPIQRRFRRIDQRLIEVQDEEGSGGGWARGRHNGDRLAQEASSCLAVRPTWVEACCVLEVRWN